MSQEGTTGSAYGHRGRAFLQALLARQVITFEEAKPLIAAIETAHTPERPTLPADVTQDDFEGYIQNANDAIAPFDLEIRSALHQSSRDRIYALVNTTSDAMTQMATLHSADDIAFVKRVLDAMFDTYNTPRAEIMAVTSTQALKLAKAPQDAGREPGTQAQSQTSGLTMGQAEKVLDDMVAEGWFEFSRRGFYSLSPRALMELRDWLVRTYDDQGAESDDEAENEQPHKKIQSCDACRDIVTIGQRCPDLDCYARLHEGCVSKIFRAQQGQKTCPRCKTVWENAPFVGERAARGTRHSADDRRGSRSTGLAAGGGSDAEESI